MLSPQVCRTLISSLAIITSLLFSVSGVTQHTYLAASNIYCPRDISYSGDSWKNCFPVDFPQHCDHDYSHVSYDPALSDQVWTQSPGEVGYGHAISEEEASDCGQAVFDETIQRLADDTMSQLDIVSHAFYKSVFTDSYEAGEASGVSGLDNSCNLELAASCSDGEYQNLLK